MILLITNTACAFAQDGTVSTVATPKPAPVSNESQTIPAGTTASDQIRKENGTATGESSSKPNNGSQLEKTVELNSTNSQVAEIANLDKEQMKKLLEQANQPEPYQISCAPQMLNSSIKDNYNAYTIAVFPSKLMEIGQSDTYVFALNATFPQVAGLNRKTIFTSVIGKSFSSALGALPSFLMVAFGQPPTSLVPSVVSMVGTTMPVITSGASDYGNDRVAIRESRYYDGIFRDYEAHLKKTGAFNKTHDRKHNAVLPESPLTYRKLPLYSNVLISKQSNNGKPVLQVTNAGGQSWAYSLTCDNQAELSLEHQQALNTVEKLKSVINISSP
jgi:hypothetical protein